MPQFNFITEDEVELTIVKSGLVSLIRKDPKSESPLWISLKLSTCILDVAMFIALLLIFLSADFTRISNQLIEDRNSKILELSICLESVDCFHFATIVLIVFMRASA